MKRILAILMALTIVFALAACGGKDDPKPSGGGTLGNREDNTASSDGDKEVYEKVEDALDALPESKVEIKGDTVVQTTPVAGGGTMIMEYIFDGDQLKRIKLSSEGTAEVDDASFNSLKAELEAQGYGDFKKSGKTITAVCEDIENSAYAFFATFNKENLKATLEGNVTGDMGGSGGAGGQSADYRIAWEDIKYMPEGMPKLYDKVSSDYSDPASTLMSIGWNVLPQADMEDIKAKLEQWLGAPLEDLGMPGVRGYMYNNDSLSVNLYYYEETIAGMSQCTLDINVLN